MAHPETIRVLQGHRITLAKECEGDLDLLPASMHRSVFGGLQTRLVTRPTRHTPWTALLADFTDVSFPSRRPVWTLRGSGYRVIYDVDEKTRTVVVRAIVRRYAGREQARGERNRGMKGMKKFTIRDFQKAPRSFIDAAQSDLVVLTRYGKPVAMIVGIEGQDWEMVHQETDPHFWELIERRRRADTVTLEDFKKTFGKKRRHGQKRDSQKRK